MTSEIESKISRVINKLENVQTNLNFPPITNETQEGNYRMQKKIAGIITQANVNNISSFDGPNESNQTPTENSNDISNSFSEQPSEIIDDQCFPKPSMNRRASIILDLNKIINVGEYKIELGKLLNILDKKLPENKENIANNDASKTYTQCTTEENEPRKSFVSPEKKKVKISENIINENSKDKSPDVHENNKDVDNELIKDKKFEDNLAKKYHKIALLLKGYMNENKLINELNKKTQNDNNNNYHITLNDTMNNNLHRKSLFDNSTYLIPPENYIQSFGKRNTLPHFISNFFEHKKDSKRKKRNSYVSGRLCNKLKKLNQQMNAKSISKKIPQSEKAEFKIKSKKSSDAVDSNVKPNNMSSRKSISQISNFDMSNNADSDSIICNDNSVYCVNDHKRTSFLFNDKLSAVKQRRESDFFDNIPQQQEEIAGFHKMINTIVEEEDNNNNNGNFQNINENDNKDDNKDDKCNYIFDDEDKKTEKDKTITENETIREKDEDASGKSDNDEEEEDDEDDDDDEDATSSNEDCCYKGNISTSLCFDDLNIF
jgi:hypothetical protein